MYAGLPGVQDLQEDRQRKETKKVVDAAAFEAIATGTSVAFMALCSH